MLIVGKCPAAVFGVPFFTPNNNILSMKAKCIEVKKPETPNDFICVMSFRNATNNDTLGGLLFSAVLNGENATYYLPIDLKALKPNVTTETFDTMLGEVKTQFEGQLIDGINLYDITATEVDASARAFKVVGDTELQPITVFHRAYFGTREKCVSELKVQILRQLADSKLEKVEMGE